MDLHALWTAWPSRDLAPMMKTYLLVQWAFWLQQIIVIHIEERRKDHWQMLTHHFVTTSLIWACYGYGHTRVGNLILILMDIGDLILPVSINPIRSEPPLIASVGQVSQVLRLPNPL